MEIYRADKLPDMREPVAVILGMFDGVHVGHAAVIRAAQETGLRTALVTFTEHPAQVLKNRRAPELTTARQRERIFAAMQVDFLIYLDFKTIKSLSAEEFIQNVLVPIRTKAAFCGFNYTFGAGGKAGPAELERFGERYGFTAVRVPPVCDADGPVSSTRIREQIVDGRMEDAARLLGRPFTLEFPVIHGRQLGRKLGIPTINQRIPDGHVCPRYGVYAASALVDGCWRDAVASVGVKPTVGSDDVLCETFIFDYDGDLYDRWIEVALHTFLRPEERFAGVEELKTQMERDIRHAKAWLARHKRNRP
ncbi:riboflavin biosynthesis protein RibF [Ethanoligenens harbinense]|uniref:Riboflavin biosynthesis protein n=1 Tax=Ethanoligenens harbinense (strain DSM 18485 / JCM 12961 / CGMCC 1.5033 / YUAN-3) TaxID=663278 RepID=E6U8F2_ETHHY|nr:riboflavin biosynthesis protein RibF [Ethanoligenens harbinense]ADU28271.1 riboflavin biosynthesis protein RibF [Ethanoligenens harbinense YUAN-3]